MKKIIFANTMYQVLARLSTAISFFIITILMTRFVGADFFGKYAVVLTYIYVFFVLSEFGFNSYLVKEYSKDNLLLKRSFVSVLLFKSLYGLILSLAAIISIYFVPYSNEIKLAVIVVSPVILVNSIFSTSTVIFQTFLSYKYQFISSLIGSITGVITTYLFLLLLNPSLNYQVFAYFIGYLVMACVAIYLIRKNINFKNFKFDKVLIKNMVMIASPYGFSLLVNFLMINADRIIMTLYSTYSSIAIYSVAYRVFELILIVPAFFMNSMFPVFAKMQNDNHFNYLHKFKRVCLYLLGISIIISSIIFAFSWYFIPIIFGQELKEAYIAINLLAVGIPIFFITSPLGWMMLLENKQRQLLLTHIFVLFINISACFIFIPIYDYKAAALITTLSELMILVSLVYNLRVNLRKVYKS